MLSTKSSCNLTTLTVSLYISVISWIDFYIYLYYRTALSCITSDCVSSRKSGRFNFGYVEEVPAGASFKFLLAWVRCKSLKRKVALSNLSSIAMRIDYFNFYAVCLRDFMSTAAPLSLFMFCSHSLRCSFTLSMRFACASR